jgi:hypothetical protein
MTLAAKFGMAHGAVLRTARPEKPVADVFETETLERAEARIFTLFPERTATVKNESRESARRKACLIGMCAPTCVFLSLAVWYLAL